MNPNGMYQPMPPQCKVSSKNNLNLGLIPFNTPELRKNQPSL